MMSSRRVTVLGVIALTLSSWGVTSLRAQVPVDDATPLFDDGTLHDVRIRVNARDWETLIEHYDRDDYYPADFVWQDRVVRNIGIRSRGSGSRNPTKPGLKIDFNRYVSGQRLLGLNALVLDNLYQDPALVRERVAMKLFEKMNVIAPREVFTRVWINDDIYLGVYAIVESIDSRFLRRPGLDRNGFLYDYEWQDMWWFTPFDELDEYERRFQPETQEDAPWSELFGVLDTFVRTTNAPHRIQRDIGEFLDIQSFLRYLAVETFLAEWDGIVGDFGINNFYLYRPSTSKQFTFIPWDKDNTFKAKDYPVWPDRVFQNKLTEQLLNDDELRSYYFDALLDCVRLAEEGVTTTDAEARPWLLHEIETQFVQIREAALADGRKPIGNDTFEANVDVLREFARERPAFVRAFVASRRR